MKRFLISFDDGAMDHVRGAELDQASIDTRAVVADAKQAGVWIFGCGLAHQRATVVATDGSVSDGPDPDAKLGPGGLTIIEVETRDEAHEWAARIAAGCRCAQDVREILYDPES